MGKMAGITPIGLLLLPPNLVKDNLVIQCSHISINIAGHVGEAATRVAIFKSNSPGHKDRATMESRMNGSNYGCT